MFPPLTPLFLSTIAASITDTYKNFIINEVNNHCVRLAAMQGEYPWHLHPHSDECFLTLEGCLEIDLDDGKIIHLNSGQIFTVPAGTLHRTRSKIRIVNLCFETLDAYTDVKFAEKGEGV